MKFVCTFAWTDLEIHEAERKFVDRLIDTFGLQDDRALVLGWLESPPPTEDVDPTRVPKEHRQLVLDAARELFESDGVLDPHEQEQFELLEQLLA